jgi:hypothetical protein
MGKIDMSADFDQGALKAYSKNEAYLIITLANPSDTGIYWCECEVRVRPPLSLVHDGELNSGKAHIGILQPRIPINKKIKIFTRPNNYPDEYPVEITVFVYDEGGAISERIERKVTISCKEAPSEVTDSAARDGGALPSSPQ